MSKQKKGSGSIFSLLLIVIFVICLYQFITNLGELIASEAGLNNSEATSWGLVFFWGIGASITGLFNIAIGNGNRMKKRV